MGADIYDWDRVHGKGSYQKLIDGGCSGNRHQAGCSHGVAPHVWPAAAALEAAWEATKDMRIDLGPPLDTAQRADFLVAALQAAWGALGERTEKAENLVAGLKAALCRHTQSFTDSGGAVLCGGCLEPSPCPDAGLCNDKETS